MLLRFLILLPLVSACLFCQAQDDEYSVPFTSETGVGINFNTNGGIIGGAFFKRSSYIRKNMYHYIGVEFVNVKHPKEQRYSSSVTGNSFIYQKQNYLFSLRGNYGREFLLFHKSEEEGVRVSGIFAGGATFGIVKPYAIDYNYSPNAGPPTDVRSEPFDPKKHTDESRILGTGGLFTAVGQSKIVPGLNMKAALAFEFGNSTTGVEIGGLLEVFPKKIIIIPRAQNTNIFTSIYINIYFAIRN